MSTPDILSVPLSKLAPHPMLERLTTVYDTLSHLSGERDHAATFSEHHEDWTAFVDDIRARGVREPIRYCIIKGKPLIVDGRHRWQAAKQVGFTDIRGIEVTEEEGRDLMESSFIARQNFTKSMRAYAAVVMHPTVATDTNDGKGGRPKKNPAQNAGFLKMPELADRFGVSLRLVEQACELYRALDSSPTLRAKHEWRVRAGFGLGAILAGIAGDQATSGKARGSAPSNIGKPIATLRTFWQHYAGQSGEERDILLEQGQRSLSSESPDFISFMAELAAGAARLAAEAAAEE